MRRLHVRLAAACVFAAAMAIFLAGAAFAGGGNGNGNGHEGSDGAPAAQTQSSSDHGNGNGHDGWAQQSPSQQPSTQQPSTQQPASQQSGGQSQQQAGVKPSNDTKHWTHTTVGAKPDVSKRYGNGQTAAEIAASRGAPADQPLTGPGNSQPHKTYDCTHKDNKSGGVDVHAIKSYSASSCASVAGQENGSVHSSQKQGGEQQGEVHGKSEVHVKVDVQGNGEVHAKGEEQQQSSVAASAQTHVTICHATGSPDTAGNGYVMISPSASGVFHGHYSEHSADIIPPFTYNGQTYSANWTKNGQAIFNNGCRPLSAAVAPTTQTLTTTTTVPQVSTTVPTTTQTVAATTTTTVPATTTVQATTTVTTTTGTTTAAGAGGVAGTTTTVQQQQQNAPSTTTTAASPTGGVLGAQTSQSKPASQGGVLGTVTHVAGSSLPFTGFPVWLAVLIAIALILAGFALRRRTLGPRGL